MLWLATLASLGAAEVAVTLQNPALAVGLDPAAGYAVAAVVHRPASHNFVGPDPKPAPGSRSPWLLRFRDGTGRLFELTTASASAATHRLEAEALTVTWSGVHVADAAGELTVTLTVRLPQTGAKSYWTLAVTGTATGVLWEVVFPRVFGVQPIGDDWLCLPHYWGRRVRAPARSQMRQVIGYPQPGSMQFLAFWGTPETREPPLPEVKDGLAESGWAPDRSDALGLYWATEDGQGCLKQLFPPGSKFLSVIPPGIKIPISYSPRDQNSYQFSSDIANPPNRGAR